jgi:hypothetical protein
VLSKLALQLSRLKLKLDLMYQKKAMNQRPQRQGY